MNFNQLKLLKIAKPIWYHHLHSNIGNYYWIDYRELSINEKLYINYCDQYKRDEVALIDVAYQAWNRGFINHSRAKSLVFNNSFTISINDEYRFIRRMFKPIWVYYVLFIRLIRLNNPFREFRAFFQTKNVHKININHPQFNHDEYNSFNSKLD